MCNNCEREIIRVKNIGKKLTLYDLAYLCVDNPELCKTVRCRPSNNVRLHDEYTYWDSERVVHDPEPKIHIHKIVNSRFRIKFTTYFIKAWGGPFDIIQGSRIIAEAVTHWDCPILTNWSPLEHLTVRGTAHIMVTYDTRVMECTCE